MENELLIPPLQSIESLKLSTESLELFHERFLQYRVAYSSLLEYTKKQQPSHERDFIIQNAEKSLAAINEFYNT